jgi:lipase
VSVPDLKVVDAGELALAVWDWPGDGPPLVFVHATGFHGRCWDAVVQMFPGRRAIVPDLRGHGRSPNPDPPYHWRSFGRDLAAIAERLDLHDAIGIGHSMGGHTLVAASAIRPGTFSSLLLVDPTIYPPERYGALRSFDPSFVLRRRNAWTSPDEMYERFRGRPPFGEWKPEVLHDYCNYGLTPAGDGYVLACPPEVEYSIYSHSGEPDANLHQEIANIQEPVTVMRAGIAWQENVFNLSASPTDPKLASRFPNGRDVLLEGRSHYIPMEWPERVAEELNTLLAADKPR